MVRVASIKITGLQKLKATLQALEKKSFREEESVVVGFTQNYAVFVHEDLQATHKVGQAKYLEAPARRLQGELGRLISSTYVKTKSLSKSLLVAGLRLQREAQLLVPVDTSALKASAYTAFEKDSIAASTAAFQRSEQVKNAENKSRSKFSKKINALKADMNKAAKRAKKKQ